MAEEKNERNKILLVTGLAVAFMVVGYFRFFHGKISFFRPQAGPAGTSAPIGVPDVDLSGVSTGLKAPAAPPLEARPASLRNIFAPPPEKKAKGTPGPQAAPAPSAPAGSQEVRVPAAPPPPPMPSLILTGTIVGGKSPLAVINGQFLKKGEWIEGLQVMAITETGVTLAGGGRKIQLDLLQNPGILRP